VASGVLDQSVILCSERGKLTVIDCREGGVETLPSPADAPPFAILLVHSGVSRTLFRSGFNTRVSECREAARRLLAAGGVEHDSDPRLCDVPPGLFDAEAATLPEELQRRAAHYFGEMRRVEAGIAAWRSGDLIGFGELVTRSGDSSIHNYESAAKELVTLHELLRSIPGVFGTRFNGGGFGGSCLALVDPDAGRSIGETVQREYCAMHPELADDFSVRLCRSADGLADFEVDAPL
jgi:galactokinase